MERFLEEPGRLKTLELRMIDDYTPILTSSAWKKAAFFKDINNLLGIMGKYLGRIGRDPARMLERWDWDESGGVLKAVAKEADGLATGVS